MTQHGLNRRGLLSSSLSCALWLPRLPSWLRWFLLRLPMSCRQTSAGGRRGTVHASCAPSSASASWRIAGRAQGWWGALPTVVRLPVRLRPASRQ